MPLELVSDQYLETGRKQHPTAPAAIASAPGGVLAMHMHASVILLCLSASSMGLLSVQSHLRRR